MNFRIYDILTQLIPGVFFTTIIIVSTNLWCYLDKIEIGNALLFTIICFIIGFVINTIGQILEAIILKNYINNNVKKFTLNKKVSGFLRIFIPFTKLRHIGDGLHNSKFNTFSKDFDNLTIENHDKISWLNQDKKFARSITSMSIILILLSFAITKNTIVNDNLLWYYLGQFILLFSGIYRYFQSSIDYAIWVIKFSGQNSHLEAKKNE
jgi:hypothetical protein